ncbi:MAG TPA: hypothetical protein VF260_09625, partial [Bacilli bacterium]
MILLLLWILYGLLFLLFYIFAHYLLQALIAKVRVKVRLYAGGKSFGTAARGGKNAFARKTSKHLADLLASLGIRTSPGVIVAVSIMLLSVGILLGSVYFSSL